MSIIIQKIKSWNHSTILQKCTTDDGLAVTEETLQKLSSITWEGPLPSRHLAVSLFDKLAKRSSSLSAKIIPIACYLLQHGSLCFKIEVQHKKIFIEKLRNSALQCQGTHVDSLYQELVELIEYEYKRSLLGEESVMMDPSFNDIPTKTKGATTRAVHIEDIVSPEKRMVDQITAPSCIEPLPPMVEIWQFASQYKHLNQHAINAELVAVLQRQEPMSQLRALSVVEYLTQRYHNSCKATFLHVIQDIGRSDNRDLQKTAAKILVCLGGASSGTRETVAVVEDDVHGISPCPLPPTSGTLVSQTLNSQDNLFSTHMKRSYDKIVPTSVAYRTMQSSESCDESLLDLTTPSSSSSFNTSPPASRFFSFFSPSSSRHLTADSPSPRHDGARRRSNSGSTDNLLPPVTPTSTVPPTAFNTAV